MANIAGVIGIPTLGMISSHFLAARAQLQSDLGISWCDKFVTDEEMRGLGRPIDVASKKQYIAEFAVEQGAQWVLYIDDDVIFPPSVLLQLMHRNKDIVGGVYWSKSEPPMPLIFKGHMQGSFRDWHVGDFFKVDAMGMGLTFIRTSVFKKMSKPWFSLDYTYQEIEGRNVKDHGTTEDLYFYKKAHDYGFEVWCDTAIQAYHYDKFTKQFFGIRPDFPQAIAASDTKRGEKLIIDIGSGGQSPYFPEGTPVRADIREDVHPDILCDVRQIPEPDNKYDIAYAADVLEHFGHGGSKQLLKEWTRILKVGGEIRVIVPNIEWACHQILENRGKIPVYAMWVLYGAQDYAKNFHAVGFTAETLADLFQSLGNMKDIKVTKTVDGTHLYATATKASDPKTFESIHPKYSLVGGCHLKEGEVASQEVKPVFEGGTKEAISVPVSNTASGVAGNIPKTEGCDNCSECEKVGLISNLQKNVQLGSEDSKGSDNSADRPSARAIRRAKKRD